MEEAVIVRAKRTPVYKKNSRLGGLSVQELLIPLFQNVAGDLTDYIDDVLISNAVTPGGNVARLAALAAGFPESIPGMTIDRQCSGGLDAVRLAAAFIESGMGECYLVGGAESPSTVTRPRARFSPEVIGDPEMPAAAENVARALHISRTEQDEYTVRTYERAWQAYRTEFFQKEIVPVAGCSVDEAFLRRRPIARLVRRASPLETGGTVTAANSCGMHDGAAVLLIMSRRLARRLSLKPVLTINAGTVVGFSPLYPAIGPIKAINSLLEKQGMNLDHVAHVEIIEAFAVKIIASLKQLRLPEAKVNRHGGSLTLGHPYSASGIILIVHLFYEALFSPFSYAIAASGSGGGLGAALLIRNQ
ncbi:acetyl-CoA C-acyltransferase [Sporolactobacillus sp. THM7-4]|nr:acetyl-CoA C-acyltransferase [Sporolactobacillus sp. THM7-4]